MIHVSERVHAAVILMTMLAERFQTGEHLSLQRIAEQMGLSVAYLEEIAADLRKADLVQGKQGPNGGYRLVIEPSLVTLEHISTAVEGAIELVDCQKSGGCPIEGACKTKRVWNGLREIAQSYLRETTLEHLCSQKA